MVFQALFIIDDALVFITHFIIQYLEFQQHNAVLEPLYDGVVSEQYVFVGAILEGSGNDSIGFTIIYNHYILISTARADRKSASVISINFSSVFKPDVHFIGWFVSLGISVALGIVLHFAQYGLGLVERTPWHN